MWWLASQSAYRMILGQKCSQNLAPLPLSFLSIVVILMPSASEARQVSMGTGVDTEPGKCTQRTWGPSWRPVQPPSPPHPAPWSPQEGRGRA